MPKTAVDKDSQPYGLENEIGPSHNLAVSSPSSDPGSSKKV
jgi:hypothetical protein